MMSERRPEDGHYAHRGSGEGFSSITTNPLAANGDEHRFFSTNFERLTDHDEFPYATTFNCLRKLPPRPPPFTQTRSLTLLRFATLWSPGRHVRAESASWPQR